MHTGDFHRCFLCTMFLRWTSLRVVTCGYYDWMLIQSVCR